MTDQPTPETDPEDLTGAWTPDPPIGCLQITAAHDSGPSIAEAAADDARWWGGEKRGE